MPGDVDSYVRLLQGRGLGSTQPQPDTIAYLERTGLPELYQSTISPIFSSCRPRFPSTHSRTTTPTKMPTKKTAQKTQIGPCARCWGKPTP